MLAIRLQRRGRKGHAQFRVILQDSHRSPSSGKVTAFLGSFNPHTKTAQLDTEKIDYYLKNGAQPSNRAAKLFKEEGIKLPKWVAIDTSKSGKVKNPDKFGEEGGDTPAEATGDETEAKPETDEKPAEDAPAEKPADADEKKAEDKPAEEEAKAEKAEDAKEPEEKADDTKKDAE